MANKNLTNAKKAKNDEFYTQFSDIQKEIESYLEYDPNTFKGKVVYSNCDDPFESNFFRYFVLNFKRLGLKRLIATSYKPSPVANTQLGLFGDDVTLEPAKGRPKITANKFIINEVGDVDGDGSFTLEDIALQLKANKNNEWTPLEGDGDFKSDECVELLKQSDIVVTNPPFSLFREYIKQLFDYEKKFAIIGNMNAITYKEVFPKIKENKLWVGATNFNTGMYFQVPDNFEYANTYKFEKKQNGIKVNRVPGVCWFTNLDHGRRHAPVQFMTMQDNLKFNKRMQGKESYDRYDNYNAIEISFAEGIPSDHDGAMGVPISFLNKYNPGQFEILGATESEGRGFSNGLWDAVSKVSQPLIRGERMYKRIFIKHKKVKK
ncbi:MAG: DNA methyltransferase [Candidatus Vogelbacteria bacterium CG10_big_fil_rev_8_21_14_0_10_45_14]|uniref:DNA methyltransferase n=1 Tax=Candidatus Vogelbacteria bacterium CG10_big_fil_rev_8_21_14_0_10_45_14 TaxID=1975042 RepID=A0A2H0RL94_9BACT|nr:MAG: DNA methyltransferase [Candidatus Vogelbacteria bacterium CG10_big_fil_rev_8_21_14_0_10_45_14]